MNRIQNTAALKPLQDKIAVVAAALEAPGAASPACWAKPVLRSTAPDGKPASGKRPETIEETAEMVTAHGGIGIYVQVDHTAIDQVEALFARVRTFPEIVLGYLDRIAAEFYER